MCTQTNQKSDQVRRCLLSCGSSPGWQGPSSQHAKCAAAAAGAQRSAWWRTMLRPYPEASIRMWAERMCVCLCVCVFMPEHVRLCEWAHINVFVRQGKSQHSGPLSSKTMISIKCRCFLQPKCFHQNPSSLCSQTSHCNQLVSFSRKSEAEKKNRKKTNNNPGCDFHVLFCFSRNSAKRSIPASEARHFLCDTVGGITNASLLLCFSKRWENTIKSRKQSSLSDLITVLFSPRPRQNRKVNQAVGAWRLIYETKVHEI